MATNHATSPVFELTEAHAPVSPERERPLILAAVAGDATARHTLVLHNLRMVVDIARRYSSTGADLEDLVQEGVAGLLKAIDRFDPARELRFSTYAHWWIRQAVARFVKGPTRVIRVPEYILDKAAHLHRAREEGNERLRRLAEAHGLSPHQVMGILQATRAPSSLEAESDAGGSPAEATLPCPRQTPEATVLERDLSRSLVQGLKTLPLRQQQILALRYRDGGRRPTSLKDVAPALGISAERVRQLERRALVALRDQLDGDDSRAA